MVTSRFVLLYFVFGRLIPAFLYPPPRSIVDAAFTDHTNSAQRSALVQEFYSPEFAVFKVCLSVPC